MDLTKLEIANNLAKEIDFLQKHLEHARTLSMNASFCTMKATCSIAGDNDFELVFDFSGAEKLTYVRKYVEHIEDRLERCKQEFESL